MQTINIGIIIFPCAQSLDITGPHEVFSSAQIFQAKGQSSLQYRVFLIAKDLNPVKMSSGLTLVPDYTFANCPSSLDTLIVPGSETVHEALADLDILNFIKSKHKNVRRLVSICTGAFFLAKLGLLDGKNVTTHWAYCSEMKSTFPQLCIDPDSLYIKQDHIYTSAGVTSGMDLSLALVEEDSGKNIAMSVARKLVIFYKRPGGQKQFSEFILSQSHSNFCELIDWILDNLSANISVETLAQHENMSARNFSRKFKQEFNKTPAKFIENLRLQQARVLLENEALALKSIARACGFKSEEKMRRAFQRELNITPNDYRTHF